MGRKLHGKHYTGGSNGGKLYLDAVKGVSYELCEVEARFLTEFLTETHTARLLQSHMGINFTPSLNYSIYPSMQSFELYSTLRSSLLNYSTLNLCTITCHIQHVGIYNYTSVHGHIMLIQPGWFLVCSSDIWSCRRICCHREWREVSRRGPRSCGRNLHLPLPDSVAWSVLRCVVCVFLLWRKRVQ